MDGIRVGVFGLGIQLKGLVQEELYRETTCLSPVDIGQDMARTPWEEESCDLVVCLSHPGNAYSDPNRMRDQVLIQQMGCYGVNPGRVDFYFHADGRKGSDSVSISV